MVNRKEFDENIKQTLLEKFGRNEFKISWEDLADALQLDLPKTKYHIFKLEQQGFLRVVERSQRANGYTSPNIIRIFAENPDSDDVISDISRNLGDLQKWAEDLQTRESNIKAYEDEIRRQTITIDQQERSIKLLKEQLYNANHKILELTQFGQR
jgi:DNA-binding Lrp family transcriptional regulator